MSIPIIIDQLHNAYCDRIVNLILPIQQIEFNVPVTLEGQPDLLDIETHYQKKGGNFWGARYDEELVGTIALINIGHKACALRKMFVKKEFRGKEYGIAQRLLEKAIDFCKENAISDIYLGTVDMLKAAHRFYEKNAFTEIEMEQLPEYFPRMPADNKFYHLHI